MSFILPQRRFNALSLLAEKNDGRLYDASRLQPRFFQDSPVEFYATMPSEQVFGGHAWHVGNTDMEGQANGVEVWYPQTDFSSHILVCHHKEEALRHALGIIVLNALCEGYSTYLVNREAEEIECLNRVVGRESIRLDLANADERHGQKTLLVYNGSEAPGKKLATLFAQGRGLGITMLYLVRDENSVPLEVFANTRIKLMELPSSIQNGERIKVKLMDFGLNDVDEILPKPEDARAQFWKIFSEGAFSGESDIQKLLSLGLATMPESKEKDGNKIFCDRARSLFTAWLPVALTAISCNRDDTLASYLSPENCDKLAKDEKIAQSAGWKRMAALWMALGEMGWQPDAEDTNWRQQFGYAKAYMSPLFYA